MLLKGSIVNQEVSGSTPTPQDPVDKVSDALHQEEIGKKGLARLLFLDKLALSVVGATGALIGADKLFGLGIARELHIELYAKTFDPYRGGCTMTTDQLICDLACFELDDPGYAKRFEIVAPQVNGAYAEVNLADLIKTAQAAADNIRAGNFVREVALTKDGEVVPGWGEVDVDMGSYLKRFPVPTNYFFHSWSEDFSSDAEWVEQYRSEAPARALQHAHDVLTDAHQAFFRSVENIVQLTRQEGIQFLEQLEESRDGEHPSYALKFASGRNALTTARSIIDGIKNSEIPVVQFSDQGVIRDKVTVPVKWEGDTKTYDIVLTPRRVESTEEALLSTHTSTMVEVWANAALYADNRIEHAAGLLTAIELVVPGTIGNFVQSYGDSANATQAAALANLGVEKIKNGDFVRCNSGIYDQFDRYATVEVDLEGAHFIYTVKDRPDLGSWIESLGFKQSWHEDFLRAKMERAAGNLLSKVVNPDTSAKSAVEEIITNELYYPGALARARDLATSSTTIDESGKARFLERADEAVRGLHKLRQGDMQFIYYEWNKDSLEGALLTIDVEGKATEIHLQFSKSTDWVESENFLETTWKNWREGSISKKVYDVRETANNFHARFCNLESESALVVEKLVGCEQWVPGVLAYLKEKYSGTSGTLADERFALRVAEAEQVLKKVLAAEGKFYFDDNEGRWIPQDMSQTVFHTYLLLVTANIDGRDESILVEVNPNFIEQNQEQSADSWNTWYLTALPSSECPVSRREDPADR